MNPVHHGEPISTSGTLIHLLQADRDAGAGDPQKSAGLARSTSISLKARLDKDRAELTPA